MSLPGVTAKAVAKVRGVAVGIVIALFTPEAGECTFVAIFAAVSNGFGGNFLSPQVTRRRPDAPGARVVCHVCSAVLRAPPPL